jgi:hypothetical protein
MRIQMNQEMAGVEIEEYGSAYQQWKNVKRWVTVMQN